MVKLLSKHLFIMLKIKLATKLLYTDTSKAYYNEDFMNVKTYDISYPFNQLDEKYTKTYMLP